MNFAWRIFFAAAELIARIVDGSCPVYDFGAFSAVGQYVQRPIQPAGFVITATTETPDKVLVGFVINACRSFFLSSSLAMSNNSELSGTVRLCCLDHSVLMRSALSLFRFLADSNSSTSSRMFSVCDCSMR